MIQDLQTEHLQLGYFEEFGGEDTVFLKEMLEIFVEDGETKPTELRS